MLTLKDFSESDLPEILALQNKLHPLSKRWTLEDAKAQFTDIARKGGRNVLKVMEDGALSGVVGWVSNKESREFYGAPFFVSSDDSAQLLIEQLLKRAESDNSTFVRVGVYLFEKEKLMALKKFNFKKSFDFIEMEIVSSTTGASAPKKNDFKYVPSESVDPVKYKNLYYDSFREVSNAPPADDAQAKEIWNSPLLNRELSGAWVDSDDVYIAFMIVHKDGYIDSIGISPSHQRKGIGESIYQTILSKAKNIRIERLRATIASNNIASLKFHEKFGFKETDRREIWQVDL